MPAVEFVYAGGGGILSPGLVFSVGWWWPVADVGARAAYPPGRCCPCPTSGTIDQATLSAFQQVFSRIPAGAGRIDLPGTALNQRVLVQRETRLSPDHTVQQKRDPPSSTGSGVSGGVRACETRNAVTTTRVPQDTSPNGNSMNLIRPFDYSGLRKPLKTAENRGGLLEARAGGTVPLPGGWDDCEGDL